VALINMSLNMRPWLRPWQNFWLSEPFGLDIADLLNWKIRTEKQI